jgi:hypothetical protein
MCEIVVGYDTYSLSGTSRYPTATEPTDRDIVIMWLRGESFDERCERAGRDASIRERAGGARAVHRRRPKGADGAVVFPHVFASERFARSANPSE